MISFNREEFLRCLSVVDMVVPRKSPRPILLNVRLSVSGGEASLLATDQEMSISCQLESRVEGSMLALLPSARLRAILAASNSETVGIEAYDGKAQIVCGSSEFLLPTESVDEFPTFGRDVEFLGKISLSAENFCVGVRRTVFATDEDSARYALGGVKLEWDDGLTLVATDSRRLAVQSLDASKEGETDGVVIPERALAIAMKMVAGSEGVTIGLSRSGGSVYIGSGNNCLMTRLMEGRFPQWKDVIPREKDIKHEVDVPVGSLLSAVRQASITTSVYSHAVAFSFKPGVGVMLGSRAADVGSSSIELPIPDCTADLTVHLAPQYLREFLQVLQPDDVVKISLSGPESAVLLSVGDDCRYVVMPVCRD